MNQTYTAYNRTPVTREMILQSICPKCGSTPGQYCLGRGVTSHQERASAAAQASRRPAQTIIVSVRFHQMATAYVEDKDLIQLTQREEEITDQALRAMPKYRHMLLRYRSGDTLEDISANWPSPGAVAKSYRKALMLFAEQIEKRQHQYCQECLAYMPEALSALSERCVPCLEEIRSRRERLNALAANVRNR